MTFTTRWLLENRITFTKITEILTIEEVIELSNRVVELSSEIPPSPPVLLHSIVDTLNMTKQPALAEYVKVRDDIKVPPNAGWVIFVNKPNSIIRFVTNIVAQFVNVRFRFAESIPEAINLLQQLDNTLPDLSGLIKQYSEGEVEQQAP